MNQPDASGQPRDVLWHTLPADEVLSRLGSSREAGLAPQEAEERLKRVGANRLAEPRVPSFWQGFFEELAEPMMLLLLVTAVLYAIWGEIGEAVTIFCIILLLNTMEVLNELRAKKAIASLRQLAEPLAMVRRGGRVMNIAVEELVPGDIVYLRAGSRVPTDGRLVEAYGLTVDESTLTGESLSVEKDAEVVLEGGAPLAERRNMVYAGTLVTRGKGTTVVTATGMNAEIGKIARLTREVKEPRTHLQQMMSELSKPLVWAALGFSVLIPLLGVIIAHQQPRQMLLTGLSLVFAMIPEELPIIITMVLALGAYRLSKRKAVARNLQAVEALGAVTVIATDKTGTLTENRMEVIEVEPVELRERVLQAAALCNDAVPDGDDYAGDPADTALLRAARQAGVDLAALREAYPLRDEFSFDNLLRRMAVVVQQGDALAAIVKGAPGALIPQADAVQQGDAAVPLDDARRAELFQQATALAAKGLRVIGVAVRRLPAGDHPREEVESGLTLLGLIGLADIPRAEAPAAIAACQRAGIRTVMVTGDHPLTAQNIARQVGLASSTVVTGPELETMSDVELIEAVRQEAIFARTTPEHKYRIVRTLQAAGERVAVTGDGVNDAPALAAANVGIAMGERGTDVAREASDLVLADDNFSTIVTAIREGRLIFANLQKGVRYYLACKVALLLITLIPTLLQVPVPFAPVQIILMELFMDMMAAAAFTIEAPESDLLAEPPRNPQEKFMDRRMNTSIAISAAGLAAAVLVIYLVTWYGTRDVTMAQTAAFYGWLIGHVLLAFNLRSVHQPLARLGIAGNRLMLYWGALVALLIIGSALVPGAGSVLKTTHLAGGQWLLVVVAGIIGTFWMEIAKLIQFKDRTGTSGAARLTKETI